MKLITVTFFTYIRSVLLYLLFTLPAAFNPRVYLLSVVSACVLGIVAWAVFALFTFLMRLLRAPMATTYFLLCLAVAIGVLCAYAALLAYATDGMHFWDIEMFSLFPAAAIIAGWISIYINRKKLRRYFKPVRYAQLINCSLHQFKVYLN